MKEFYNYWLGGMTKHDALEHAKQAVKAHKDYGWDDPHFWAAFILLDGLD
jgi:CHAT domain-containing protein